MKLKWNKNHEAVVPLLDMEKLGVKYQQELLKLADYLVRNQPLDDIAGVLSQLPIGLKPCIYSIFLHMVPLTVDINDIITLINALTLGNEANNDNSIANPDFHSLLDFLNKQNKEFVFHEYSTVGFMKAKMRSMQSYQKPEDIEKFIQSLTISEAERNELVDWFNIAVVPSFYVMIKVKDWERISYLNDLNEFIELAFERCKTTVGDGVFFKFLKNVPLLDLLEFNENAFTNLFDTEFELLGNIFFTIVQTHKNDDLIEKFKNKWYEVIITHKHNDESLKFSLDLLEKLDKEQAIDELKESLKLGKLLKIYDLQRINQINDSSELQRETLLNSLQDSNKSLLTKESLTQLLSIRSKILDKLSSDEFHELILNSLLSNNQFNLIKQMPNIENYEDLLTSKFWYYYKHEFNSCYKILDYIPKSYTVLLSSISSLPGITPLELLNTSSSQEILEHFFQLNPKEYLSYSKYNNILNVIAELIPNLQISMLKTREVAIEYGLLESDFIFIIDECFTLLESIETDTNSSSNESWLLIYKVTKIISINYANDEIDNFELIDKNLQLLLKLLKIVPVSNVHDVIETYQNLKKSIALN